jgi:hypothetical protein
VSVSYRTSTPDVCTVSGRTVTTRAAGACTITASQVGDDRYAPARDAARSFRVERAAQIITFTPPDGMTLGQPVTLSASASSGLDVSYRTDTPAVCTVSGATVSPATAGTCTITASQPGNDNYAPASDIFRSFPIHSTVVRKTSQTITFAQPSARAVGQVASLSASATSGLVVSFRSAAARRQRGSKPRLGEHSDRAPHGSRPRDHRCGQGPAECRPDRFPGIGWQKHREVIAAARRTMAAPGSIELVDLATHQITATQRPRSISWWTIARRPPSSSA